MESTVCLLKELKLKASGHFKVGSVFLVEKGACSGGYWDIALHLEREFQTSFKLNMFFVQVEHVPKSVANAFVDVWKQSLVVSVVPCF